MAEEEAKKKINFKKIALFGLGPIVLIGIGLGVGAFLFMPTQTPVEQVEELIEKKLQQAGQLPSAEGEEEAAAEPEKVYKDTPSTPPTPSSSSRRELIAFFMPSAKSSRPILPSTSSTVNSLTTPSTSDRSASWCISTFSITVSSY